MVPEGIVHADRFMESGAGWVPFVMERMDGEFEKRRGTRPSARRSLANT
jgi:hypothetical protein